MIRAEDVVGDEPAQRPDFGRKEVGRGQDLTVRGDELLPGRALPALGSRTDTVAAQDVGDGLVAQVVAQIDQGTGDPVVAPAPIL